MRQLDLDETHQKRDTNAGRRRIPKGLPLALVAIVTLGTAGWISLLIPDAGSAASRAGPVSFCHICSRS
jgi:hypothetical protein